MFINLRKVVLKINDYVIKTNAIIDNNIVSFKNLDILYSYDFTNNILKEESDEFFLILDFKKKTYTYLLKEVNKHIEDDIIINNLQIDKNKVIINYQTNENDFILFIEVEEEK